jgi:hypothetical protein
VFREASDSDWSSVDNLLVYTLDVDARLKLKEMSVNSVVFTHATGLESKSEYISYYMYGKGGTS